MNCCSCPKLKKISLCTDSIVIGRVPIGDENQDFVVYFKSLATDAIYSYPVTSNDERYLTLTFTDGFPLASDTAYEIWANKVGDSIEKQYILRIGDTTSNCYTLYATRIFNIYEDENQNFESQTLEVADE